MDRAGQIRKATATNPSSFKKGAEDEDEESDLSSDEEDNHEIDSDDVDSDGLMEDFMNTTEGSDNPAMAQQQDFIHF